MATDTNTNGNPQGADSAENNNQDKSAENQTPKSYNDDQVNAIVKKSTEKERAKILKEFGITDPEEAKTILAAAAAEKAKKNGAPENKDGADNSAIQSRLAEAQLSAELANLENVMLTLEILPAKVEKAVRLIDLDECRDEDGKFSKEKAKAAVDALLKDWPELKKAAESGKNGFVIGSDGQQNTNGGGKAAKTVSKPWNRFNQ